MNTDPAPARPTLVIGEFHDPDQARRAMLDLEGAGIDADAINLLGPTSVPAPEIEESGELDAVEDTAKRVGGGALVGSAVGALIGGGLGWLLSVDPQTLGIVAGLMCGAIVGFLLGGFWAGASRLPVNTEALDTYSMEASGGSAVRVQVRAKSDDEARLSADVLRKADADVVDLRER